MPSQAFKILRSKIIVIGILTRQTCIVRIIVISTILRL